MHLTPEQNRPGGREPSDVILRGTSLPSQHSGQNAYNECPTTKAAQFQWETMQLSRGRYTKLAECHDTTISGTRPKTTMTTMGAYFCYQTTITISPTLHGKVFNISTLWPASLIFGAVDIETCLGTINRFLADCFYVVSVATDRLPYHFWSRPGMNRTDRLWTRYILGMTCPLATVFLKVGMI